MSYFNYATAYILTESPSVVTIPTIKKKNSDWIRMECILQTAGDINKNRRRYMKEIIEGGLSEISDKIKEGSFIGELDHPVDSRPVRQVSVLYEKASHRILDYGWEGNNLVATVETLNIPNGHILRNLALQGVPIGYSLRGMGEVRQMNEGNQPYYDVYGTLKIFSYDSVSNPSHATAKMRRITESVMDELNSGFKKIVHEAAGISEKNGMICTKEGFCYLPNQFDKLVEQRAISLVNKFKV